MRNIIAIGESVLDTVFRDGQPVKSFVGGRIANALASLSTAGMRTFMVSECTTDRVGDIIMNFFTAKGVDIHSVDRYPDGSTRLSAIFEDGAEKQIVNYGTYPEQRFDVVWPRINEDDIVLFGSLYAVDLPQRKRLYELLKYAEERKAILVYLPGFQHGIGFRITHVMPNLLENLELSSLVLAHQSDISFIFPGEQGEEAYHNHIEFYDNSFVYIDSSCDVTVFNGSQKHHADTAATVKNMLGWQSGLTAGIIYQLVTLDITHEQLPMLTADQWRGIIAQAQQWAQNSEASADNCIDPDFAKQHITDND